MIGSTPKANLNEFMHYFQTLVSKTINKIKHRINHNFGSRYGATVIRSELYLSNVIRYLYQNPVCARICDNPQYYPYSSLPFYLNTNKTNFFVFDPYLENINNDHRLDEKPILDLSISA